MFRIIALLTSSALIAPSAFAFSTRIGSKSMSTIPNSSSIGYSLDGSVISTTTEFIDSKPQDNIDFMSMAGLNGLWENIQKNSATMTPCCAEFPLCGCPKL
eukprot:CAMPEP_0194216644 /NCGR_PEP_ID=MMETSP0156-20130528/19418_1 /TAXON_ID=33649 /ORGANISM="Thalassionema nitzschioides, Strain L26-B" /LENGTH=100 /DNA_ID=CAMNT_0038945465 /DNA_START=246 /DNA_END=548 /DNA_ORIENTATION=-